MINNIEPILIVLVDIFIATASVDIIQLEVVTTKVYRMEKYNHFARLKYIMLITLLIACIM